MNDNSEAPRMTPDGAAYMRGALITLADYRLGKITLPDIPMPRQTIDDVARAKDISIDLANEILEDQVFPLTPNERLRWEAYRADLLAMTIKVPADWPKQPGSDCPHCGKEVPF